MGVRFRVLGPFEVLRDDEAVQPTSPKQRLLLAVLLVHAGEVVSADTLVDALWRERPPATATGVLQTYVSQLRKAIEPRLPRGSAPRLLLTAEPGYRLAVAPEAVDSSCFERLLAEGRSAIVEGQHAIAAEMLREGLAIWRGPALADLADEDPVRDEAQRLDALRVLALEQRIEADIALGRHGEVVTELEGLVAVHPLRERLWAQLMVCLYRTGRQTDALAAFQQLRRHLRDELGLEPGSELRQLEHDILTHASSLEWSAPWLRAGPWLRSTGSTPQEARASDAPCPAAIQAAPAFAFVGRHAEQRELDVAWSAAQEGERRTVLIGGESGAGKTRLAFEFARRCWADGAAVLLGTCDSELAMPYQPWVQVLEQLVRGMPTDVAASLSDDLTEVALLVPELERIMPRRPLARPVDPGTEQYRLFAAVDAILTDAARRRSTIVVIDDLQWASPQSLALLRHLSRPGAASRLLVTGAFRDTGDEVTEPLASCLAQLRRTETTVRLRLMGLDQATVEQFVAGEVGHELDRDLRALASMIAEHSGGNALYVSELWRHVVASGVVVPRDDRWVVGRSSAVDVPESVREVVADRVAGLSRRARQVLELAAVAGQQVDLRVLDRAVNLPDGDVGGGLDELVEAKLLLEIGGVLPAYVFAHAIVRDTVAHAIPSSARARLHERVAEAIESVYEADQRPVLAQLAGHFAAAAARGGTAKATHYCRRAAGQAMDLMAYDEAVRHLSVALELSPLASEERVDIRLDLGAASSRLGLARQAMDAFAEAFREARELGLVSPAVRAASGFEEAVQIHGLPGGPAIEIVSEALALLGDEDSPLRTRLQACLAVALGMAGREDEGEWMSELAIAAARRQGEPKLLLAALKSGLSNDFARWLPVSQEMGSLAHQVDDPWAVALARTAEIRGLLMEGRIEAARGAVAAFRHAVDRSRFVFYRSMGMHFEVMLGVIDGRFDDAERVAEAAQDFGSASGSESDAGVYGLQMYVIRREQGRLAEVAPVLRLAAALEPDTPVWRPGLAALFADLGMLDEARREFERLASDGFESLPRDAMWPCCLTLLAEVCVALGDRERAELLYGELEAFRGFTMMVSYTICLGPAERLMGSLAALSGRDDAEAHFVAALQLAERSGSPVWRAHVQHDWAAALGTRPDLMAAAATTARQLGMGTLEDRCRIAHVLGAG